MLFLEKRAELVPLNDRARFAPALSRASRRIDADNKVVASEVFSRVAPYYLLDVLRKGEVRRGAVLSDVPAPGGLVRVGEQREAGLVGICPEIPALNAFRPVPPGRVWCVKISHDEERLFSGDVQRRAE